MDYSVPISTHSTCSRNHYGRKANTIIIENDKIAAIGTNQLLCDFPVDKIVDANKMTIVPGLIEVFELNTGLIEVGKLADLVIMDAPLGSAGKDALGAISIGDILGIAMVIAKGEIVVQKSRNTPPYMREVNRFYLNRLKVKRGD